LIHGHSRLWTDDGRLVATGGSNLKLLVFRNDALDFTCSGATCVRADGELATDYELSIVGSYNIVAIDATAPVPATDGRYDSIMAMAMRAGHRYQERTVVVR